MGHLHNIAKRKNPSFFSSLGSKIKTGLELAGTAKGIYDMGRMIYQGASTYGPMIYNTARAMGPTVATAAALL